MINLSIPRDEQELKPRITVIGVGGAGGNAVNNMIRSNLVGCEFVVCNTDAQALQLSAAPRKIQLGTGVTRGLGAGARPDVGRAAAEEAVDDILDAMQGSNMVFITAGMGGGTGTGAAPVIARTARESGILTVGVVTKPFQFEGVHRMRIAEAGIEELQKYVDTLIIIPNQNLFRIANERTTFADAFKMADDVLHAGVRGVTDLMVMPGLINLDFADIRTVMSEMGKAMMGTGEADGERRAIDAAEAAINNPLLEDVSMKGARGVLINITGGTDMTLFEVDEAANRIREEVDPEANIIFGSTFDEKLAGRMRISVVATGIEAEAHQEQIRAAAAARAPEPALRDTGTGYMQPVLTQNAAAPASRGETRSEPAATEKRAESPVGTGSAGGQRGRERGGARRRIYRAAPGRSGSGPADPGRAAGGAVRRRRRRGTHAPRQGRVPSLIERMTGMARSRPAAPPAAPRAAAHRQPWATRRQQPPRPPTQRLAPLEEPRPTQNPAPEPGAEQGRRAARHPGLPAPPGELTGQLNADRRLRRASGEKIACPASPRQARLVQSSGCGEGGALVRSDRSQCDTAAAACSSTSAPVAKRSSANGAASGCGSSRAIVWAKTQPAPGVALNPPVPQPPFRYSPPTGNLPMIGDASGATSTMPAQLRSILRREKIGNSSKSAAICPSMTWNEPRCA